MGLLSCNQQKCCHIYTILWCSDVHRTFRSPINTNSPGKNSNNNNDISRFRDPGVDNLERCVFEKNKKCVNSRVTGTKAKLSVQILVGEKN